MDNVIFTNDDKKRLNELTRMVKYARVMTANEREEYIGLVISKSIINSQKSHEEETYNSQARYDATENWHY